MFFDYPCNEEVLEKLKQTVCATSIHYMNYKNYRPNIENLLKAVELNDRSHDLYYQLAVNYYYLGNIDEAIDYLYKGVSCDDTDIEAHVFLGELLLQKENYEEAYKHLSKSDFTPVTDTISATAYADVCIHLQKYNEAIDVLLQLIKQDTYEPHYLFDIILCYLQLGDYEKAAEWVAHSEKLSYNTEEIETLDESSRKTWFYIKERIEELRNILNVYLDEKL